MKKTIALTHPKLTLDRLVDSIKHDVKKYIKRERNKQLPSDQDYWDFDCKYGTSESEAASIHLSEINKSIDTAAKQELESFYLEILVKPAKRLIKDDPWSS
ncbi:MAG: hypothetical protein HRU06_18985 [Oceanospirillaceae bacterium]|nr:hypothetical protein [Oceanospirillaceae bacterium]